MYLSYFVKYFGHFLLLENTIQIVFKIWLPISGKLYIYAQGDNILRLLITRCLELQRNRPIKSYSLNAKLIFQKN